MQGGATPTSVIQAYLGEAGWTHNGDVVPGLVTEETRWAIPPSANQFAGKTGWTMSWGPGPAQLLSPLRGLPRPADVGSSPDVGRDCRRLAPEAFFPVGRDCLGLALGRGGLLNECMCPTPCYPA